MIASRTSSASIQTDELPAWRKVSGFGREPGKIGLPEFINEKLLPLKRVAAARGQ
jgi:hypothetical protein